MREIELRSYVGDDHDRQEIRRILRIKGFRLRKIRHVESGKNYRVNVLNEAELSCYITLLDSMPRIQECLQQALQDIRNKA